MTQIHEIELAISNCCGAMCAICSNVHGGENDPLMHPDVFDKCISDMREIDFQLVQTGGDGDAFLNPLYISYLRKLRKEFPKAIIVLYSNFQMFGERETDIITGENLLNRVYTRVDTLNPVIYKAFNGLEQSIVFDNIKYFLEKNKNVQFQINYSSIKAYKDKCKAVFNKDPFYWDPLFDTAKEDEYYDIQLFFNQMKHTTEKLCFNKIKQSLWAERHDPKTPHDDCMPCQRTYCFDTTCYVWTDGDVGICGYDDGQDTMIVGNVIDNTISEIWNSDRRKQMIEKVKNRGIKGYPCSNPRACLFY